MVGLATTLVLLLCAIGDDARLTKQLEGYFRAKTVLQRRALAKEIVATEGLTCDRLTTAIRGLALWDKQKAGRYEVSIRLGGAKEPEASVLLSAPADYAPAKRWPMIIALHGKSQKAAGILDYTRRILGSRANEFIIAAPEELGPLGFTSPPEVVGQPRALVIALRKMFHLDNDRVYLLGYSLGGHNAWMTAVLDADCFAGFIPLATPIQLIGGDLLYEELLPNARNSAILFCWGAMDAGNPGQPAGGNAKLSRELSATIRAMGFKNFEAVELARAGHGDVVPPPDALAHLLEQRRQHFPKRVHQAFRLAEQSRAYWIETEGLQGEALAADKLQIHVRPGEDPRVAQRKFLIERLGLLEAACDGQTLKIKSRKSKEVVLLLSDELLDLSRPVTVARNAKTRYEGPVTPDMNVMLVEAARDWDFDRLYIARMAVPVGGKVRFGYAAAPKEKK